MNLAGAAVIAASFLTGAMVGGYAVWRLVVDDLRYALNEAETQADELAAECQELRWMAAKEPVSVHHDEPMGTVYPGIGFVEGFYPDDEDEPQAWERPAKECRL